MKNNANASKRGTYQDWKNGNTAGKKFLFKSVRANSSTTVTKSNGKNIHFVGVMGIPAFSIINEDGYTGVIRYDPFEPTIYKNARAVNGKTFVGQNNDPQIAKTTFQIKIKDGYRTIDADTEPLLLDFMMKDEKNLSNPNRRPTAEAFYELVDYGKKIEEAQKNDDILFDVRLFAKKGEWDKVLKIARVISNTKGYNLDLEQTPDEIRYALDIIAKHNPMAFNDILKDPRAMRKATVLEAIDENILVINEPFGTLAWRNSPDLPICTSPVPEKIAIVDFFVNNSSSPRGEQQYSEIKMSVAEINNKGKVKTKDVEGEETIGDKKVEIKFSAPIVTGVLETDEQIRLILDKALGIGVATENEKKTWITFKYKEGNEDKKVSFQKGGQMCEMVRKSPEAWKLLKTATGVE